MFLDSQNILLGIENLFIGTITASAAFLREVIAATITYHTTNLIFGHNYPFGNPVSSHEDRSITRDLLLTTATIQIKVLDHIIIVDNRSFSLAADGLLARYVANARGDK